MLLNNQSEYINFLMEQNKSALAQNEKLIAQNEELTKIVQE